MLRRIFLAAVVLAVVGLSVFWWLTIPASIPAAALPAYQPNAANGQTMFNAGGCSSCHAVPDQPDRTRLGGGFALTSPFGTFYVPNISPDPKDGKIRRLTIAPLLGEAIRRIADESSVSSLFD